ncbi:acetyltransferase [Anoxybacter fermentans]|uniref:Acetyltransferase n=1 Tax=Anoxybacter fermentans TaxID=1323375 RepID=A0A3Q9HSU0_9FIRM|nr:acetyltransferase [Anoxybacter fermentans]
MEYRTTIEGLSPDELKGFFVGWKKPLTTEQHYQILRNSSYVVLAYETGKSKVVGFINALSDGVYFAFIPMLEVLPEYQHMGIGSRLMEMMLELLKHITCIDLTCDIEMQNFYKKFGMFKSHGMIIRKYINQNG